MKLAILAALVLLSAQSCEPYNPEEVVVSRRFALVLLDVRVHEAQDDGQVEQVRFSVVTGRVDSYQGRPPDLATLVDFLVGQLRSRGFQVRCSNSVDFPFAGPPRATVRMARGREGVGIHLRQEAPATFLLRVGPMDPNPPLFDCRGP